MNKKVKQLWLKFTFFTFRRDRLIEGQLIGRGGQRNREEQGFYTTESHRQKGLFLVFHDFPFSIKENLSEEIVARKIFRS